MKKISMLGFLLGLLIIGSVSSYGAVFTFTPDPADLYDLDHYYAYTWGIDWNSFDYPITSASLTFTNIYNWTPDLNDILYMNLLDGDGILPGVTVLNDGDYTSNYFDGVGTLFKKWTDDNDNESSEVLTVSLDSYLTELNNYASDGSFAFGFDPDCHYWNDGVQLTINADVPEPTTMLLFGLGALGLAAYRRKH